jgi:uncharacterized protein (DUF58 family)
VTTPGRPPPGDHPGASGGADTRLAWAPSAHYRRLATVALLPLLAAVLLGHAGYVVLAAPLVAALALAARRPGYGARVTVRRSADRCVEGEDIAVRVRAAATGPTDLVQVTLLLPPALEVTDGAAARAEGGATAEAACQVTPLSWGRWSGQAEVRVRSRGGLFEGSATVDLDEFTVFPRLPTLSQLALPAELHTRIGDHVDRHPGDGVEFAGVRPFTPGDRLRRINWPVTSRRGTLHVNQLAAERAAEIIAFIDAFTDAGPPGESTLDRAVRGAAGLAHAYTRAGDRVGVITMYGPLRWIAPGTGHRQFFRVVESVLDARDALSYLPSDVSRVPRAALPPGALTVFFSPLLDDRAIAAAMDLRERGHALIVVDTLATQPQPGTIGPGALALRLWHLERQALWFRLESVGIPVTGWPGDPGRGPAAGAGRDRAPREGDDLDSALGRFTRHRVRGGAR